jgi:hypothetical protein
MKKISKNISYKEATYSETAKRKQIANKPAAEHVKNMELIAEKLFEPLREWVGGPIRVNSFFRSEALNREIKGAYQSQHLTGNAIDITTMGKKTNSEMFHYIKENLDFDKLIWEFGVENPQWIHVSYVSKEANRKKVYLAQRKGRFLEWPKTGECKTC